MSKPTRITVSQQIQNIPPVVRPIVRAARRTVRALAPKAVEVAYQSRPPRSKTSMWKIARYAVGETYVVAIGTFPKHVHMFFYRGRELDDCSGLLQGGGKDLRYINLKTPADASHRDVKRVLRRAFELAASSHE